MHEVVIVGAGPAGLAVARALRSRGIRPLLLERADRPGFTWTEMPERMRLVTPRWLSHLAGKPLPDGPLYPERAEIVRYLEAYAGQFRLDPRLGCEVTAIRQQNGHYELSATTGTIAARFVVLATGLHSNPFQPQVPGLSRTRLDMMHSSAYRNAETFRGLRVLVVGGGDSAAELCRELCGVAREIWLSTRRPLRVLRQDVGPLPVLCLTRPLEHIPARYIPRRLFPSRTGRGTILGTEILAALTSGKVRHVGPVERFEAEKIRFTDGSSAGFDRVIFATGFRPALSPLRPLLPEWKGLYPEVRELECRKAPGVFLIGLPFLRTLASQFLRGMSPDAEVIATTIYRRWKPG